MVDRLAQRLHAVMAAGTTRCDPGVVIAVTRNRPACPSSVATVAGQRSDNMGSRLPGCLHPIVTSGTGARYNAGMGKGDFRPHRRTLMACVARQHRRHVSRRFP